MRFFLWILICFFYKHYYFWLILRVKWKSLCLHVFSYTVYNLYIWNLYEWEIRSLHRSVTICVFCFPLTSLTSHLIIPFKKWMQKNKMFFVDTTVFIRVLIWKHRKILSILLFPILCLIFWRSFKIGNHLTVVKIINYRRYDVNII